MLMDPDAQREMAHATVSVLNSIREEKLPLPKAAATDVSNLAAEIRALREQIKEGA